MQYTVYIVTEAGLKANENCMAIHNAVLWPKGVGLLGTVSQYTLVYCDRGARGKAGLCRNTTQPSHDTAQTLGVGRAAQARAGALGASEPGVGARHGGQQAEQAYNRIDCIVAYRRLNRHTVGSVVLWHIEG